MRSHPFFKLVATLCAAACLVSPLHAMTFTQVDPFELSGAGPLPTHMIYGSGPIVSGDAQVFEAFIARLPATDFDLQWGIALNSPGGGLLEGVRLGEAFRRHVVTTVVLNGHTCESACAVAFLGGAAQYATAEGVMRLLQPGGRLGFHGIAVSDEAVAAANDTLDLARATNAVIRDYAIRMGVADDGLVQSLFNMPPEEMEYIDTPAEILGVQITLAVDEIRPPADWALNLCRHAVAAMLQTMDPWGLDERVGGVPERIGSVEAFRGRLLAAKHNEGTALGSDLFEALARAPAETAVAVLAGQPLYLDQGPVDIWDVGLNRGAGFYYDSCFAVAGFMSLTTVLVDGAAEVALVEQHGMLAGFPAETPLW